MRAVRKAIVALGSATALGSSVYWFIVRPTMSRWDATDDEVGKVLPGDELESPYGYRPISTRAITIDAPPEEVWPWLVQMGSGRAGSYTHEWVERLLFVTYGDGHSANRIHPERQELHVGDRVPYSRFTRSTSPPSIARAARLPASGSCSNRSTVAPGPGSLPGRVVAGSSRLPAGCG